MADRVVITTGDLEHAVRINAQLESAGFETALATSVDEARQAILRREPIPDCLVLTGGLHEPSAAQLLGLARDRSISTLGLVESTEPDPKGLARGLGLTAFLEKPAGGRGLLLGGVPGVQPGRVLVIGGGIVGYNAAVIALGLGANVTILDRSVDRMRHLEEILSGRVTLLMSSTLQIEESVAQADLVIGAVLIPGALAPKLVSAEMIRGMKQSSVVVDVAIDQGGCFATSHATTHSDPVYEVDGVVHYCVANMPGAVPITSTKSLTNSTLPYVEQIADHGLREAVARDSALARGVNAIDGKLTYEAVAEAHGLPYTPLDEVIPLAAV